MTRSASRPQSVMLVATLLVAALAVGCSPASQERTAAPRSVEATEPPTDALPTTPPASDAVSRTIDVLRIHGGEIEITTETAKVPMDKAVANAVDGLAGSASPTATVTAIKAWATGLGYKRRLVWIVGVEPATVMRHGKGGGQSVGRTVTVMDAGTGNVMYGISTGSGTWPSVRSQSSDLIGAWVDPGRDSRLKTLQFLDDGSFRYVPQGARPFPGQVPVGTWRLEGPDRLVIDMPTGGKGERSAVYRYDVGAEILVLTFVSQTDSFGGSTEPWLTGVKSVTLQRVLSD